MNQQARAMPKSDQFSISAYAVSVVAIICIEIAHSDDIAVLNVITLATMVVSARAIAQLDITSSLVLIVE